LANRRQ